MCSNPSLCPDCAEVKRLVIEAGAVAVGIARAEALPKVDIDAYSSWLASGCHAGMDYLERYSDVRSDPRMLLDGARSVIVAAFPYAAETSMPTPGGLRWARYALGDDYHEVLRHRLSSVADRMEGTARVCVDTAPLRERLWAVRAGVGFIGRNNQLIVPGIGSYVLLAAIITTLQLAPDRPSRQSCLDCGQCVSSCPGGALRPEADGRVVLDARRCLSMISIERRGETVVPLPGGRIYGCDTCQEVCPHNNGPLPQPLPEFRPRPDILALSRSDILQLAPERYAEIFRRSAIKRARLAGLRRNALGLSADPEA